MPICRLRLNINTSVESLQKVLFSFDTSTTPTFSDLADEISEKLGVPGGYEPQLYLDAYLIPTWTSTMVVRDDEEINVRFCSKRIVATNSKKRLRNDATTQAEGKEAPPSPKRSQKDLCSDATPSEMPKGPNAGSLSEHSNVGERSNITKPNDSCVSTRIRKVSSSSSSSSTSEASERNLSLNKVNGANAVNTKNNVGERGKITKPNDSCVSARIRKVSSSSSSSSSSSTSEASEPNLSLNKVNGANTVNTKDNDINGSISSGETLSSVLKRAQDYAKQKMMQLTGSSGMDGSLQVENSSAEDDKRQSAISENSEQEEIVKFTLSPGLTCDKLPTGRPNSSLVVNAHGTNLVPKFLLCPKASSTPKFPERLSKKKALSANVQCDNRSIVVVNNLPKQNGIQSGVDAGESSSSSSSSSDTSDSDDDTGKKTVKNAKCANAEPEFIPTKPLIDYPDLTTSNIKVDSIIAFKALQVSGAACPELSDWKLAKVLTYSVSSGEILLKVINKYVEHGQPSQEDETAKLQRFLVDMEDSTGINALHKQVTIKFEAMVEAKLLKN